MGCWSNRPAGQARPAPGGLEVALRLRSVLLLVCVIVTGFLAAASIGNSQEKEKPRQIVINLPEFALYLYENGKLLKRYPIAVGQTVSPSLLGETRIVNKVVDPTYYPPDWARRKLTPIPPGPANPVGSRWMGLGFEGYGIHGTSAPDSIGRAASSGCIRLTNRDVEELFVMVRVGTKVTLVYETILVTGAAPGDLRISIFEDIYSKQTNTLERALAKISEAGFTGRLKLPVLELLLQEAPGTPTPIPVDVGLYVDGELLPSRAYREGSKYMIPVESVLLKLGEKGWVTDKTKLRLSDGREVNGVWLPGQGLHVAAEGLAALYGFGLRVLPALDLEFYRAGIVASGHLLSAWAYVGVYGKGLLPAAELASEIGIPYSWDGQSSALKLNGRSLHVEKVIGRKPYISPEAAGAALGLVAEWIPGERFVVLRGPRLVLNGVLLDEGYLDGDEPLVPVRKLATALGFELGWDPVTQEVSVGGSLVAKGPLRFNKLFVTRDFLRRLLPDAGITWDRQKLELRVETVATGFPETQEAGDPLPGETEVTGRTRRRAQGNTPVV